MDSVETLVEQRTETRTTLSWPVSVWLPQANRFFNGKSSNISKGGVFITVPLATPIRAGHVVELNFPRTEPLAREKGSFARIKKGRVIRVVRGDMLTDASLGLAISFMDH